MLKLHFISFLFFLFVGQYFGDNVTVTNGISELLEKAKEQNATDAEIQLLQILGQFSSVDVTKPKPMDNGKEAANVIVFFCFSAAISDKKSAAPALPLTLPNEILDEWKEIEKQSNLREKIKFWGKKGEEISDSKLRKLVHEKLCSVILRANEASPNDLYAVFDKSNPENDIIYHIFRW